MVNLDNIAPWIKEIIEKGENEANINALNEQAWNNRRSNLGESYQAAFLAEELSTNLDYKKGIGQALKTQGYCLWRYSDYHSSMEKSSAALEIAQEMNDKKDEADILNSIGAVYMFLGDNDNRLKCNLKCLEIRKEIGDHLGYSGSLNNTGETYMEMGDFDKAIEYFETCVNYEKVEDSVKGWVYFNLGIIEDRKGNYQEVTPYLKKSIERSTAADDKTLTCETLFHLGINYGNLGELELQEATLTEGLELATRLGAKNEMQKMHLAFSNLYEQHGDFPKALEHFKTHSEIHKEVYNEQNASMIHNLKNQYEINSIRKEAEVIRLKNVELKKAFDEIESQKNIIEKKNKSISDSIQYAEKIQSSVLSYDAQWDQICKERFILFKPRDVVSGDFYWAHYVPEMDYAIWAVADCTGHGVPGAFMSMLGAALLNAIIVEGKEYQPDVILNQLRERIIRSLHQKGQSSQKDGMDISICVWDKSNNQLQYAGAYNSLWVISDYEKGLDDFIANEPTGKYINVIKADKQPVGPYLDREKPFTLRTFEVKKGDRVYAFSDGFVDQFGGPKGKKFMKSKLGELLFSCQSHTLPDQKEILDKAFVNWMNEGNCSQLDDVCVVGIEIE